jgi:mono/diheme cytochrome c family protein
VKEADERGRDAKKIPEGTMTIGVKPVAGGLVVIALLVAAGAILLVPGDEACAAEKISFSEDVFPIFAGRCVSCHQPGQDGFEKSGLDLTTYEGLMKGTKFGPMVIPKDPESSNLIWLLDWRGSPQTRMPHGKKKLSICDRNAIRSWIREGAKKD